MCLYPRLIANPKYKESKKNGGNVPQAKDKRVLTIPVGCGDCFVCKKQKARNWQYRLIEEVKSDNTGKFVTLTFDNESLKKYYLKAKTVKNRTIVGCKMKLTKQGYRPRYIYEESIEAIKLEGYELDNAAATIAVREFLERIRKETKKSIKHWLVTEIGGERSERIHLHGIIFTNDIETICKHWKNGYVWKGKYKNEVLINYVNEKTCSYITKYMLKVDKVHPNYKSIVLCSKGIGSNWCKNRKVENYRTSTGHKTALNNYWKQKMFNDDEREELWIKMLDKNERWIDGIKYKADDIDGIQQALNRARELNKELGYKDGSKKFDESKYEKQLRVQNQFRILKSESLRD